MTSVFESSLGVLRCEDDAVRSDDVAASRTQAPTEPRHLPRDPRSVQGQPLFVHDVDRLDFLSLYETAARKADWRCHAWCLMNTHYHLVLETSMHALSDAMHGLNTAYAQRFNRRHGRRGHLFESRFSAWVVRDEQHLDATCQYVIDNPERAGLNTSWPWRGHGVDEPSSARTSWSETSAKS